MEEFEAPGVAVRQVRHSVDHVLRWLDLCKHQAKQLAEDKHCESSAHSNPGSHVRVLNRLEQRADAGGRREVSTQDRLLLTLQVKHLPPEKVVLAR